MDYQEVLQNARQTILNCRACPECNGLACANTHITITVVYVKTDIPKLVFFRILRKQ